MQIVFAALAALSLVTLSAVAATPPQMDFKLRVEQSADGFRVRGQLIVAAQGEPLCLYLPYNNPNSKSDLNAMQHLKSFSLDLSQPLFRRGTTTITKSSDTLEWITPYLARVKSPRESFTYEFSTTVFESPAKADVILDGFYPQVLQTCPEGEKGPYTPRPAILVAGTVEGPVGWNIVGPFANADQNRLQPHQTHNLALALTRNLKHKTLTLAGLRVDVFYSSEDFPNTLPTIESALRTMIEWLGPYPYPRLGIVETSSLESPVLPGIITTNKPRQTIFQSLQAHVLNWNHWAMVTLLAKQWYGSAVQTKADDEWFTKGMVDFIAFEALRQNTARYNLFNIFDFGYLVLSLNYRQAQDLTASLLNRFATDNRLTNEQLISFKKAEKQHALLFIKHSLAMRHLHWAAGGDAWRRFIRGFTQKSLHTNVEPRSFHEQLGSLPSPFSTLKRKALQKYLRIWWENPGWPDYSVRSFSKSKLDRGGWLAEAWVDAQTPYQFPVNVRLTDENGLDYNTTAVPGDDRTLKASIVTKNEPAKVMIDPMRHIYDDDRFDNSSHPPNVAFFPGSATTLQDDAYTVFWLPYPFRRPGERWALGLQANLFKYVRSHTSFNIESQLDGKAYGYNLLHEQKLGGWSLEASSQKDFQDFQQTEISTAINPFPQIAPVAIGVRGRHKGIVGKEETYHETGAVFVKLTSPGTSDPCQGKLYGEFETPFRTRRTFGRYERKFLLGQGLCNFWQTLDGSLRLFRGELTGAGEIPENVLFNTENLAEAHLRLDRSKLGVRKLAAASSDLFLPISLPAVKHLALVNDKARFRVFFDYGKDLTAETKLAAGGWGFLLPLGGDLVASGSLTVSRFSLLVVNYSQIGESINRSPRVLLDLTGEL